ncbi:hypothetical protein SAMN04488057_107180 [Cyclobacterium lianum]|uniref:Uncharacterized protein n=1 Tax=Cyclobacterium lianum TaxID=388280 RepID=A0A1M7P997_9BACT|nr:hypothetical protein [Cyclobacterium lianum]SHN13333.1 hypothetical protein SAMN04488057_107180 [Cyclobacterium lianum]
MDYRAVKSQFRQKGTITIKDSRGTTFQWFSPKDPNMPHTGVYLIHEVFQLQALAGSFSEVALDIVEYSADKVIFHSPPAPGINGRVNSGGLIKFALIKSPFWHRLLFELRDTVEMQWVEKSGEIPFLAQEAFPLHFSETETMELHADGRVKTRKA